MRTASRYFLRATRHDATSQPLNEKRPQLKAGAATLSSGGLGAEYPEGCLSLPQPCEALRAREGRNLGTDATQSWLQRHGYLSVNICMLNRLNRVG
jgi:hypothetical protein